MTDQYLKVGDAAPDFELPSVGDKSVKLSDFREKKNVILSFHPMAWTGICANQMQDLQKDIQTMVDKDTVALGISTDTVPSKQAWAETLGISDVELLSDFEPKGDVARKYGVYRDEGFSERAVFVVDKTGNITFVKIYPMGEKPDLAEIFPIL